VFILLVPTLQTAATVLTPLGSIAIDSVSNNLLISATKGLGITGITGPIGSTNNLTYNSSSGVVSYSNNFTTQSAFGATSGTIVTANNLQFRFNPTPGSVWPQVRGNSATPTINWSGTASINSLGSTALAFSNGGTTLSSSTWTNFFSSNNMSSGGDSAIINIQDQTNSFAYRATCIRGTASDASGGSGSIIVERLL